MQRWTRPPRHLLRGPSCAARDAAPDMECCAQSWTLPTELNKLPGYLSEWEKRPSWEASYYTVRCVNLRCADK